LSEGRLKEEFLKLLREDIEFRYAVAGLLGYEEILRRIDRNTEAIRGLQEQVAEHSKAIRALQEQVRALQEQVTEHSRAIREHSEAIRALQEQVARHGEILEGLQRQVIANTEAIKELTSSMRALGMRYGIYTERAFRESIKYLIEDLLREYRVERWEWVDREGIVYGHPSVIEVDVLIRDKEHILVEYKASADKADVGELIRKGKLYEKVTGIKPKLLLVAAAIRGRASELAKRAGVEIRGEVVEA